MRSQLRLAVGCCEHVMPTPWNLINLTNHLRDPGQVLEAGLINTLISRLITSLKMSHFTG